MNNKPSVGIGACLTGQAVRYDGRSKAAHRALQQLLPQLQITAFCPETGIGLPVPRPPIHLVSTSTDSPRVLDVKTHRQDFSDKLKDYSQSVFDKHQTLCGYIGVNNSPSCGAYRVKRYDKNGKIIARDSRGAHLLELSRLYPTLPITDDVRLSDTALRESFVAQVYFMHDTIPLYEHPSRAAMQKLYSRYKYLVMAHSPSTYKHIGRQLAQTPANSVDIDDFIACIKNALATPASRKNHANVLTHISGYFKKHLDAELRQTLAQSIALYRTGALPRATVCDTLRQHQDSYPHPYIATQRYLYL